MIKLLLLPLIIWAPLEQFNRYISKSCPKCDSGIDNCLKAIDWCDGHTANRNPTLIYDVNSNSLLVSRVYKCSNDHEVLGHHPSIVQQLIEVKLHDAIPFRLYHKCGFSSGLLSFVDMMLHSGLTIQGIESILLENRVRLFFEVKRRHKALNRCNNIESDTGLTALNFPDIDDDCVCFFKDHPSRHSISACFLLQFWEKEPLYTITVCAQCRYPMEIIG